MNFFRSGFFGCLLLSQVARAEPPQQRVPDGFVVEQVAAAPHTVFPMFAVFDDGGRLFVAESSGLDLYKEISALTRKCRIRLLEDPDARGRFRKSTVWADQLVFPMGLAWRDGKLYVADPPDLITLEDTKGKGKADKRTVLLSGFGHRDNGSLHGLVFGPDGWLYLTLGDPDGFHLKQKDGTILEGTTGALLRCRPDGSEVEPLCSGFENLVEIAFTPRGEIIGTDNWYQQPVGGLRDALVHLLPGGRYPRHPHKAAPLPFTGEPLPAVSLFPAVALSGLMRYEGTAFPPAYHGNLFAAQHNARKISRHVLISHGATFKSEDFDFVTTDDPDCHPSDVFESPGGSIYFVDTGSWYVHHCPTGKIRKAPWQGGIYRVRPAKMPVIDDPWGRKIDWQGAPPRQLLELLHDSRPNVRERAQRTLSARGPAAIADLTRFLGSADSLRSKQYAVWALAAMATKEALQPLADLLANAKQPADLKAVAARALGMQRSQAHEPRLRRLLAEDQPDFLRLAAAEALARCGTPATLPELWKALSGRAPDRMLEHAVIFALHRLADTASLQKALGERHPRVQKAALLLLDQPPRPKGILKAQVVLERLASPDAELRQTALGILQKHAEWADAAGDLLRRRLEQPTLTDEEQTGLRSLILAFQGKASVQNLLAGTLTAKVTPAARRVLLLETLAQSHLRKLPPSWIDALRQAVTGSDAVVRAAAVRAAAGLHVPELDPVLAEIAENAKEPPALRLEALRALSLRRPQLTPAVFDLLLGRLGPDQEPLDRLAAAEILGRLRLSAAQMARVVQAVRHDAMIPPAVLLPALQHSGSEATGPAFLDYLAGALQSGWRPREDELAKVLDRLPKSLAPRTEALRQAWRKNREGQRARLADFEPLLTAGQAGRGRQVFFSKKAACATCHRIGSDGGQLGPDLTKIGAIRAPGDLLESILLPSSTIAQGYDPYVVLTKNGRTLTGVLARQTGDLLVLREASGAELPLPRDQIEDLRRSATSLMPEGLERNLSRDEFRDLLAFLRSLK